MLYKENSNTQMCVYDRYLNKYWDKTYTARELKELEDNNEPIVSRIRPNLYVVKNSNYPPNENDRVIFVNTDNPYFRRYSVGIAEKNKFSSVAESKYHKACKLGISKAFRFRIFLEGKEYIINNKYAQCECIESIMGYNFETDCSIIVESNNEDNEQLLKILNGEELNFEIHHTCKISENKAMAYTVYGKNILEFDVPIQYLKGRLLNKSFEEMVEIFKDYYENTERHYISGKFYRPIEEILIWEDFKSRFVDDDGNEIDVTVFRDKYSDEKIYNIGYKCGLGKKAYYAFERKKMLDYNDAKRFANYIAYMHISKKKQIDFE